MNEKVKINVQPADNVRIRVFCEKILRMLRKLLFLFILSGWLSQAYGIEAAFSHGIYYLPDPIYAGKINPYIELRWQVNPRTVHYNTNADKKILARILTDITIINDTGHVVKSESYTYETNGVDDAAQLGYLNILELKRYFLTAGKFRISVKLRDLNDTTSVTVYTDSVTVGQLPAMAFYSDVEFVDTFYESDIRTPFRKHGKQYIPICENFFDTYHDRVSYFAELYQMDKVSAADYPLYQSIFISKKIGKEPLGKYQRLDTIKTKDVPFVDGSFDISNLPSGNYYLNISLGDKFHHTIASHSLFFQRANAKPIKQEEEKIVEAIVDTGIENITVLDLSKTFLQKYDIAQLKAILKMLLPVSTAAEANTINGFLKNPEEMYMRYYIYNHFLALNKAKPERAWKEYSDKVREANRLYNSHGTAGYETQRGFMYLRYGSPSEIVTVVNENGALPYEIWQYNTLTDMAGHNQTNAIILFYKTSETDFDYRVLHTTIPGEPHNAGWRNFLYTNTSGKDNFNSRAEQYIGNR